MRFYSGDEYLKKTGGRDTLCFRFVDTPEQRKVLWADEELIFGYKDFFLSHPNSHEFFIEVTLNDLRRLSDIYSYHYKQLEEIIKEKEKNGV